METRTCETLVLSSEEELPDQEFSELPECLPVAQSRLASFCWSQSGNPHQETSVGQFEKLQRSHDLLQRPGSHIWSTAAHHQCWTQAASWRFCCVTGAAALLLLSIRRQQRCHRSSWGSLRSPAGTDLWSCSQMFLSMGRKHAGRDSQRERESERASKPVRGAKRQSDWE